MMPKISVLLPFFNPGNFFKRAIESIIHQSFSDWEMVLVNNGCTDDSPSYAKDVASTEGRIQVIDEPRQGIVFALNRGLSRCRADLIARMDADDFSLPQRLKDQYEYMLEHQDIDVCAGLIKHESNSCNTKGYQVYIEWMNKLVTCEDISRNRFIESPIAHPSVMFRKRAIDKYGPYREGEFPEDYELWLRWLENGAKMAKIDKLVLHWNDTPSRLSRNESRYSQEAFYKMKMIYLDRWLRKHNPFSPKIVIWGAGRYARKRARYLLEKGHEVMTYIDIDPKKAQRNDCTYYLDIPKPGDFFIVNLAGKRGAGEFIKSYLDQRGYKECKDYIMAAGI